MSSDFYNPNTPNLQPEAPPHDEIIRTMIKQALLLTNVWMPCEVLSVNETKNMVSVQPLIQRTYSDGSVVTLAPIQNVPVYSMRGGDYYIKPPVAVGDTGVALFCDRSIDEWLVKGGVVNPASGRYHDLSDAIFFPGLYPFNAAIADSSTDLVLSNGSAKIKIQKPGTFKIQNDSNELIDLMTQLVNVLKTQTYTLTIFGPQPFIASTNLLLDQILTKLNTLKGT